MRFEDEKIDANLELKTASGEEVKLQPKLELTHANIVKLWKKWEKYETVNNEKEPGEKDLPSVINAKELSDVYDVPFQWWLDNFSPKTIQKIINFLVGALVGR